ncbi:hypothetical protein [Anaerobacillus sp. 1_MG-2023]|uniref:hypothetical protein n=1 Tax=Anaerobacillus sp. 1_MG-2023 TaxID=3062655 RepID=UPI0026E40E47|nr:hypothetical protein [Anaerobacillus sp. 1_MG-2023]MDO6657829.1 hypothetical protein [Anaerobacillus sp. 1_MG-2023]
MDERSDKAMASPYDFVNYLTSGGADLVKGAVNPEDDFSKEHWLSSFGLASMVAGAKVSVPTKRSEVPSNSILKKQPSFTQKSIGLEYRIKLSGWKYSPTEYLHDKYSRIIGTPKYFNQPSKGLGGELGLAPNVLNDPIVRVQKQLDSKHLINEGEIDFNNKEIGEVNNKINENDMRQEDLNNNISTDVQDHIGFILGKYEMDFEKFNTLRVKNATELSKEEVKVLKEAREAIPAITSETLIQKTIPATDIEKYLSGDYAEIGGYVAKFNDVKHIKNYNEVVESFRLDYTSWNGIRPFPEDGQVYGKIKFTSNNVENIKIPYGERFGGDNTDGPPCTLNGFTGSRNNEIVPEWQFNDRYLPEDGATLHRVDGGIEELVAIFDADLKVFVPVK